MELSHTPRLYNPPVVRIAFITRGDEAWGLGHLHRVSWLWQELADSGVAGLELLICCCDSMQAREFAWPHGAVVQYTSEPVSSACAWRPQVAICDWLDSAPPAVNNLRAAGIKVALLDDYGAAQAQADAAINALLSPLLSTETLIGTTRVYAGAAYVQFPPAVTKLRGTASATARAMQAKLVTPLVRRITGEEDEPVRAVLLSFGGQAVHPAIALALQALALARYTGKVLVMPAPREAQLDELRGLVCSAALDIDWLQAGPDFHAILAAADLALLAGGLSLYEAAFLGVPAVCIALREHQRATALKLEAAGACRLAGMLGQLDPQQLAPKLASLVRSAALRRRMSAKGMELFDGHGLRRTAAAILGLLAA